MPSTPGTSNSVTPNNLASDSWAIADLLRGDFKQSQYGRIILPFALLRRLECVLEESKEAVLAENEKVAKMNLPEDAAEKLLMRATNKQRFFNTSKMDLSKLGESGISARTLFTLLALYVLHRCQQLCCSPTSVDEDWLWVMKLGSIPRR